MIAALAPSLTGPHRVVPVDCWCIVASGAMAGRRWRVAEPEGGMAVWVSGAGGRLAQRAMRLDGVIVPSPGFDQDRGFG